MKFDIQRGWLLRIIKDNPNISISKLSEKSGIAGGTTIYRYLEELESKGLITMRKADKKEKGQPTHLNTTNKAKPMEWFIFKTLGYDIEKAKR